MQPRKLTPRVLIAFACVYLFWGSTYFAMRTGVQVLPPLVLVAARFLLAGPMMLALCAARGLSLRSSRRDFFLLALIGVVMLGIGNAGVVFAERYLASGFASLIFAVMPLYVALMEAFLPHARGSGERLSPRGWLGIAIGLGGLVALLSPGLREGMHGSSHQLLGCTIALASALAWSGASVFSRRAQVATPTFVAAAWEMTFAGVFDLLLLFVIGGSPHHIAQSITWNRQAVLSVAWLVTFGSLVGYSAYIYLLDNVPVAKVSTYAYINPIVAVLLGTLLLGERLHSVEYVGMAFILAAVYLVTSSQLSGETVRRNAGLSEAETPA